MSEESLTKVLGPAGQWLNALGGALGELIIGQSHAPYYEAVKRGRVFIGSNAATGLAIPIYSAKANALTLWNPAGSDVDLVLLAFYMGYYSTANVLGNVVYGRIKPAGSGIATAGAFPTATFATPLNAYLGAGRASLALFSPAVNTTTDEPTVIQTAGLSTTAFATATTSATPYTAVDKIDGRIIIPPNCALQVLGATAIAIVANQSLIWEEVPV